MYVFHGCEYLIVFSRLHIRKGLQQTLKAIFFLFQQPFIFLIQIFDLTFQFIYIFI